MPAASDVKNTAIPPNSYGGEALVRLVGEKHLADVARADAPGLSPGFDLCLDQRRLDIARTDRVAGDDGLERCHLGKTEHTMLCSHVGRLKGRAEAGWKLLWSS